MRRLLLLVGILAVMASPALAGRNANGALVVHVDDTVVYRGIYDYCATAVPATCEELVPTSYHTPEEVTMVWFLAAFRPEASPGVTTIQFGIEHNLPAGQGYFVQYSACGPSPLELPDTGWPETGFGNLVAYSGPVYDHVFKFYWFALFNEDNESYFGTRTYPNTNEAKFVDDGNPPVEDLIFNFGTVRWEVPGGNSCPPGGDYCTCCLPDGVCLSHLPTDDCYAQGGECFDPNVVCEPNPCPQLEACCFEDFSCRVLLAEQCIGEGGTPQGPGTDCDPNLCEMEHFPEACCFDDGHCEFLGNDTCAELGGTPQGLGTTCETVVCEPVPTENTTWGSIKARFR